MTIYIEDNLPNIRDNGLNTLENVVIGGTLAVTGATTFTGAIVGGTVTATTLNVTGVTTVKSAATVPASAGAVAAGAPLTLFSDGPTIYVTSDAPAFSAVKGSLCINTGGSSSSTRLYVNNGTTNWVAVTTAS
jgi:hypothetical protein